jgi:hypothetical protein
LAPASGAQATPQASPSARATESPRPTDFSGPEHVDSAAQAAALVFASNELFAQILPSSGSALGQSSSYTASDTGSDYTVDVTLGSGDCEAGCIHSHTWSYSVAYDGNITLISEQGDPPEGPHPALSNRPATVTIRLVAGPVCPVERDPPDPSCAPRPVGDTEVVVFDPNGTEVGRKSSDATGQAVFILPGGAYYAEPTEASGLMRQAEPQAFSVIGGSNAGFALEYDTGIR